MFSSYPPTLQTSFWEITETEEELLQLLPPDIDYDKEVLGFRSLKRRKEWLAARVLFHHLMGPSARIASYPSGRPYILHDSRYISITHSGNHVAVQISENPSGIDLEARTPRAAKLLDKFITPDEYQELNKIDFLSEETSAVLFWSAKEAVYKTFDIPDLNVRNDIRIQVEGTSLIAHILSENLRATIHYHISPLFVFTICRTL